MINLKSCPIETRRYFALTNWAKELPWLEWSRNSLKAFFDGIISQAYAYKEKIGFVKTTLKTMFGSLFISNHQSLLILSMNSSDFKGQFLYGTNFEIELGWTMIPDRKIYANNNTWKLEFKEAINLVNFTFYNNASEVDSSMFFDPWMNSGSGSFIATYDYSSNDIYSGSVKLYTSISYPLLEYILFYFI